jgi:hypothetical protein
MNNTKIALCAFAFSFMLVIPWRGHSCENSKRHMDNVSNAIIDGMPMGTWGGQHIGMEVTDNGARIEYDCAHGTINHQIVSDSNGEFAAKGFHVQERGGPVREGEESDGQPARYTGRTNGKTMTLTVTVVDTNETIGTFTLRYGKQPRITKCL